MVKLDWAAITERADRGVDLDVTLSALSVEIVLDMCAIYSGRGGWGKVDDSTWDDIEAAMASVQADILAGLP